MNYIAFFQLPLKYVSLFPQNRNTLAAALSEHQDSKELLDRAGLSAGTVVC